MGLSQKAGFPPCLLWQRPLFNMKKFDLYTQWMGGPLALALDVTLLYRGYWVPGLHLIVGLVFFSAILETLGKRYLPNLVNTYGAFYYRIVTFIIWLLLPWAVLQFGGVL